MIWAREKKYFSLLFLWRQNLSKLCKQISAGNLSLAIIPRYAKFIVSCLNFWVEAWWFLSLRVFKLLSSSLLIFPQRFGGYVLRPSSCVCRNRELSRNFELRPLLNPWGSSVLIPLAITGYKVLSIPVLLLACSQDWTCDLRMIVSLEA